MKKFRMIGFLGLITGVFFSGFVLAANQAVQNISFQIAAIDAISTSGDPAPLVINSAVAGSDLTAVTNSSTTYSITTNGTCRKITGVLSDNMPPSTSLMVNLAAPDGASSAGNVALSKNLKELVTGISKIAATNKTITYTFAASVAAGVIDATSRKVTLTISD